jgi:hypothetical protein
MRARRRQLSNRERNIQRILHPPKPTVLERLRCSAWAVEEWWRRHITQRELYRRLDGARIVVPAEWNTPEFRAESLRRLAEDIRSAAPQGYASPLEEGPHA